MRSFILLCLFWAGCMPVAWSWESDVHYGLMKWLALQAGLSTAAAEALAYHNEQLDDGALSAVHAVTWYACLRNDDGMSRTVRDNHFPSEAEIPSLPELRKVDAGGNPARSAIEKMLDYSKIGSVPHELENFGKGFHALQDSWSHQGVPDIPHPLGLNICSSLRAWGHPVKRGGWRKHKADITAEWPEDSMRVAEATYGYLLKLRDRHKTLAVKPARAWSSVAAEVKVFIAADTKTRKRRWFKAQGFTNFDFLNGISIPDGEEIFTTFLFNPKLEGASRLQAPIAAKSSAVPAEVARLYGDFLTSWLVKRDFSGAVSKYIDVNTTAKSLGMKEISADKAVAGQMRGWLMKDHGWFAKQGHRSLIQSTGFPDFKLNEGKPDALVNYGTLGAALLAQPSTKGADTPYVVMEVPKTEGKQYAAVVQLQHARYDTILVIAEKKHGKWLVTGFDWVIH